MMKKRDQKLSKPLTTEEQIQDLKKKELEIERLKNEMALKYEREKTAKTEELLKKDFEDRLDYINKQWEKRMNIMNEEHRKEILMLMQNQNRQISKLQEDHDLHKASVIESYEEKIKLVKEQMKEKTRYLENKLIEQQKESVEKLLDAKKCAFSEAEQLFEKQKQVLQKEMKDERDKIIKEIVDKVVDEHLAIISKLKKEIARKDEDCCKVVKMLKEAKDESAILKETLSKKTVPKTVKLDQAVMTDACVVEKTNSEKLPIAHVEEAPFLKQPQILSIEHLIQFSSIRKEREEIKADSDQEGKCKLMYAKMQNSVNLSKAIIDILRGKLKSMSMKYQNLCSMVQDLNNV